MSPTNNIRRPGILGIVNVTPDSFSDGGEFFSCDQAVRHALTLLDDGADILDIGGESTRPGAVEVPAEEELRRVIPVIRGIRCLRPDARISIDTRKAGVAAAAVEAGATVINDVSGLASDPDMAATAARTGAHLILGHAGPPVDTGDIVAAVRDHLRRAGEKARQAGVAGDKLIFDPCLGFAKSPGQDWEILHRLAELLPLGPVLIAHSRKSFLGHLLNRPEPRDREMATAAVTLYAAQHGAAMVRVHDVRAARDLLTVWERLA